MICVLGDAHLDVVVRPAGPIAHDTDIAFGDCFLQPLVLSFRNVDRQFV